MIDEEHRLKMEALEAERYEANVRLDRALEEAAALRDAARELKEEAERTKGELSKALEERAYWLRETKWLHKRTAELEEEREDLREEVRYWRGRHRGSESPGDFPCSDSPEEEANETARTPARKLGERDGADPGGERDPDG